MAGAYLRSTVAFLGCGVTWPHPPPPAFCSATFCADDVNSSILPETSFPMCVSRDGVLNRRDPSWLSEEPRCLSAESPESSKDSSLAPSVQGTLWVSPCLQEGQRGLPSLQHSSGGPEQLARRG